MQVITWHRHNYRAFSQDAMLWHLQQKGGDETPCAFQHATGQTLWDYLESRPAEEKLFATAMQEGDIGLISDLLRVEPPTTVLSRLSNTAGWLYSSL